MRKILITCVFFLLLSCRAAVAGSPFPPDLISISNDVMTKIFQEILAQKDSYPELAEFGMENLEKNSQGVYVIQYMAPESQYNRDGRYSFGVTIEPMDGQAFSEKKGAFSYGFPLLGLKFSAYQPTYLRRGEFNLQPVINRSGLPLSLEEQKHSPLRLDLVTDKDVFRVGEPLEFDITLTNVSDTNMLVRKLSHETIYFLINEQPWGTPPSSNAKTGAASGLAPGESLKMHFAEDGYRTPGYIDIHAVYRMNIKGVHPFTTKHIEVVP